MWIEVTEVERGGAISIGDQKRPFSYSTISSAGALPHSDSFDSRFKESDCPILHSNLGAGSASHRQTPSEGAALPFLPIREAMFAIA